MIADELLRRAGRDPDGEFLWSAGEVLGFRATRALSERLAGELPVARGARVGLSGAGLWLVPRLAALDLLGVRTYLLPSGVAAAAWAERLRLHALVSQSEGIREWPFADREEPRGELVLFTSGTTGPPKAALHTWQSLAGRVRVGPELAGARWLLTYDTTTFAGLQVLLHALLNGGTLVVAAPREDWSHCAAMARVTHVSGTPSFFRLWLASSRPEDIAALRLRQVTVGGEAVDGGLLRALAERFPLARIAHVYATTEFGACFSVHDGRPGFPVSYLEDASLDVRLQIRDGELWVRSPRAMARYLDGPPVAAVDGFLPSGDLVEQRGDRVVFLGRRQERINVGGLKVHPAEVEAVMLEVPGVRSVRVDGASSSLLGQLVRARVLWDGGGDEAEARRLIQRHCRARLPRHMVPRLLEFTAALEHTPSGKLVRS